jgi:hypothetical protein
MDRIFNADSTALQMTIASLIAETGDTENLSVEVPRGTRSDRPVHA